ncbi:hypothetical protein DSCO28_06060 [Desulfosarcina ovata subsp. sediminis]|uniref:Uncharacterized protein n=1 Tax=Desulfosarcina ovata subsp. sediminis TaxID=885957 RepID=A0A5K7ZNA6_9BACT|nr:hypothetical protein [Desulfosarcina ovata]BBO80040.1 hypothetical protein DSCO28_06060 [Desulfosarcina ovata subsp. sediminis]
MKRASPAKGGTFLARVSIWTLIHHDFLAGQIRIYTWSASATVLFFAVASIIPLQTALYILLFCACGIMILLWSLIIWRKAILLGIQDQELRQIAHAAMLRLIHTKERNRPQRRIKKGFSVSRHPYFK